MNDVLPLDLIRRIFLRLPAKELFRLKCVSKLWRTLISDRDFAESHLSHYSVAPSHSCLFVNYFFSVGHIVDLDTLAFKELSLPFSRKKRSFDFRVMGSCRAKAKGFNFFDHAPLYGFGYDASQDDYLVVLAWHAGNFQHHLDCFSLRTNSWIDLDAALPKPLGHRMWQSPRSFLRGAIHWLSCYGAYIDAILIFDLKERSFSKTSIPKQPSMPLCLSNGNDVIALLSTFPKLRFAKYNVSGELLQQINDPIPLWYRPTRNRRLTSSVYTESLLPFPDDTKD
ncbi:hypothetical protein AHAS_Ahas04G0197800 [Arachis hypogaea]